MHSNYGHGYHTRARKAKKFKDFLAGLPLVAEDDEQSINNKPSTSKSSNKFAPDQLGDDSDTMQNRRARESNKDFYHISGVPEDQSYDREFPQISLFGRKRSNSATPQVKSRLNATTSEFVPAANDANVTRRKSNIANKSVGSGFLNLTGKIFRTVTGIFEDVPQTRTPAKRVVICDPNDDFLVKDNTHQPETPAHGASTPTATGSNFNQFAKDGAPPASTIQHDASQGSKPRRKQT